MSGTREGAGGSKGGEPRGHFGPVAADYAAFRPTYPPALFEHLAEVAPRREIAWDCGAGSGQATLDLANWFRFVVATELSGEQADRAPRHATVGWALARAEATPIAAGSIDLVAVAQALHWFANDAFYEEVRRVAAPGGILAAWSYGPAWVEGAAGTALARYSQETVGPYWPAERRYVDDGYRTIPFPFEELDAPKLHLEVRWTLAELLGYARSWSATSRYMKATLSDPVADLERGMQALWPEPDERRRVVWPLAVRIGRVHPS